MRSSRALRSLLVASLASLGAACGQSASNTDSLRVLAAASLRDVLDDAGAAYEAKYGVPVVVVTGGSNLVADQLAAGARADVFISAGAREVDRLIADGLLSAASRQDLLRNQLVVVAPAAAFESFAPDPLSGLASAERLSIAHPEAVPAGRYAKSWLQERGLWGALESRMVFTLDVRAALAAVASGGTDLGIVYRTDARTTDAVSVVFEVPLGEGSSVIYPAAITTASERPMEAAAFLALIASDFRVQIESAGFEVVAPDPTL